jgi:hypothetical protein
LRGVFDDRGGGDLQVLKHHRHISVAEGPDGSVVIKRNLSEVHSALEERE